MQQIDQNSEEKLEYFCPFCKEFVLKSSFNQHAIQHWNDPNFGSYPETLEALKNRFQFLGIYEER